MMQEFLLFLALAIAGGFVVFSAMYPNKAGCKPKEVVVVVGAVLLLIGVLGLLVVVFG